MASASAPHSATSYPSVAFGDGNVLDRPSLPVATSVEPERGVALSPGPGATWGASFTCFVPGSLYGADRVFLRSVSPK